MVMVWFAVNKNTTEAKERSGFKPKKVKINVAKESIAKK